ncbi:amino acid permease [bacterium]|nr:amino acid permease [bacterium]
MNQLITNLLKKKSTDELLSAGKKSELKKTLSIFDLIVIGVSAVIGVGIFAIIGPAIQGGPESVGAGPAIIISMLLSVIACVFTALCYSEISAMLPVAGSAYTYTYATMGEFAAWLVGWVLMLEYSIGNITIVSSWTNYLTTFLKGFQNLPSFITNFPIWLRMDYRSIAEMCNKYGIDIHDKIPFLFDKIPFALNLPGILMVIALTLLLVKGVKESTRFASIMVGVNLVIIMSFIIIGAFNVNPENWIVKPDSIFPFAANGIDGILMGAFLIFFVYIGFDAVSTVAEETKNPQRDLPIGILGTLLICTLIYMGVALVLCGIVPYGQIDNNAPLAHAMIYAKHFWLAKIFAAGAVCGLTSCLLIYQLGSTRILFAMSRDNFLPKVLRSVHKKYRTPHVLTWTACIIVVLSSLFLDLNISAELCNFGAFTAFIVICIAVLILRKTDPDRPRPFKVPFSPLFPLLGIFCCGGLMLYKILHNVNTIATSAVLFPVWVLIGVLIYATYGYQNNRSAEQKKQMLADKAAKIKENI